MQRQTLPRRFFTPSIDSIYLDRVALASSSPLAGETTFTEYALELMQIRAAYKS